jgi:hypothetical protein
VSDVVWQALIAGVVAVVLAYMQMKTRQTVQSTADRAATKAEEARTTLDNTNQRTDKKLDSIHTLVNSAMARQMQITCTALKRLADMTGKIEDADAAAEAQRIYDEHLKKQGVVDEYERLVVHPRQSGKVGGIPGDPTSHL